MSILLHALSSDGLDACHHIGDIDHVATRAVASQHGWMCIALDVCCKVAALKHVACDPSRKKKEGGGRGKGGLCVWREGEERGGEGALPLPFSLPQHPHPHPHP